MKSEHVLQIPFSLPGSGTWTFSVRMVVDRNPGTPFAASSPDLPGLYVISKYDSHIFHDFEIGARHYLRERHANGWHPASGLAFRIAEPGFGMKPIYGIHESLRRDYYETRWPLFAPPNSLPEKAMRLASAAHAKAGNIRKYTGEPYIYHPQAVVELLKRYASPSDEMLAAAWLHDTIEDTELTREEIYAECGIGVSNLVHELTDVTTLADGNRKARKEIERKRIAKISDAAKTIKLADLIDNAKSIVKHDPKFAQIYMPEMFDLLGVLKAGNESLWFEAFNIFKEWVVGDSQRLIKETFGEPKTGNRHLFDGLEATRWFGMDSPFGGGSFHASDLKGFWNERVSAKPWAIRLIEMTSRPDPRNGERWILATVKARVTRPDHAEDDNSKILRFSNFDGLPGSSEFYSGLRHSIKKTLYGMFMDGKSRYLRELDTNVEHNGCGEFIAIIRYHIKDISK